MGDDAPRPQPGATPSPAGDLPPPERWTPPSRPLDTPPRTPHADDEAVPRVEGALSGLPAALPLGDFYEAFHEDAAIAARALDITLTSRQKGDGAIPMAGVPHHARRWVHCAADPDGTEGGGLRPGRGRGGQGPAAHPPRGRPARHPRDGHRGGASRRPPAQLSGALWRGPDRLGVALVDVTTADFWVGESDDVGADRGASS